jgi:hypothetical protein
MRRVVLLVVVLAAPPAVAACGGGGGDTLDDRFKLTTPKASVTPSPATKPPPGGPVTAREERVIRGWTTTLRQGKVSRAARYFALPALVSNGFPPVAIRTRAQARQFNRVLTCGARVVGLERATSHRVLVTFRLTERPGGNCGTGTGQLALTAFRIRGNRISEWRRVNDSSEVGVASGGTAS